MRLDELVLKISTMLKTAAPEATYEKIKGRILKNQGFGGLRRFSWMMDDGGWMIADG